MMRRPHPLPPPPRRVRSSAAAALLLSVACAAPERPPGTIVYASGTDLESANPLVTIHGLSRQVQRYALFVTLVSLDSALAPRPYLAREWAWDAARRALTMRLATGLPWHDGAPTTARDVAFTIDAARDPATGYPRYADLADVERVDAPDDSTVVVRFARAQSDLPPVLAELPILPAHRLAAVPRASMRQAAFNTDPVGNGPFRFAGRTVGQRWIFARNAGFPAALGGPPRAERLVVAVVDEPTTKFAGLVSGELHFAGIAPTMASLAGRDEGIRVLSYPVLFSYGLVFNVARPPFDDPRVRRALSAVVDRERIVRAALAGFATPASGPVPPASPLAVELAEPGAAAADSLLDAAGWRRGADGRRARGGRPLAFTILTVGSGDNAVEQLLQADFRAHGVDVEIRQLEFGAFLEAARATPKDFDALVTLVPGDITLSHLAALFDSRLAGGALDYSDFQAPRLDALFAAARSALEADARVRAWREIQRMLHDEMPVAWIYHARGVQGVSARVRGVRMDLRGELVTVRDWSLDGEAEGR